MVSRLGLRSSRFDIFWNELNGYFNEHNNTVFKNCFNILRIDSTTKQQLCKHKSLVKFIETHCQERVYTFQCNQPTCEI
ncbi:unnamed protein product [Rhizophagus irregularis]|nr:unnamed protein product [Rhizophagus irregularis]